MLLLQQGLAEPHRGQSPGPTTTERSPHPVLAEAGGQGWSGSSASPGFFVLLPPAQHTMDTLAAYLKGHIATNGTAWGRALPVPCAGDPGTGEGADVSALLKEFLGFCLWNSGPVFIAQSPSGGNEEERGSP